MLNRSRTVIGWFAFAGPNILCDGDGCVIAGSQEAMRRILARRTTRDAPSMTIKKTTFGEIMTGLRLGAAYCFDEEAYNRLFPLAQKEGLSLGPEDFSDSGAPRGASVESSVACNRMMNRVDSPAPPYVHVLNPGGRGVQRPADRLLEDGALGREARDPTRQERT